MRHRNPSAVHMVRDIGFADVAAYGISYSQVVPARKRGDANKPLSEVITCALALPVSLGMGAEVSILRIGRRCGA